MNFNIREANLTDFNSIYLLLRQLWPKLDLNYEQLEQIYRTAVDSDRQWLIVGESENQIIGFCSLNIKNNLWQAGSLGHIDELVIDEKQRGKGYGRALIRAITEIARKNGCKRIELDSAFHRESAHDFYESLGFENRAYLFSKKL
jgi:ribosomal protein S18 acetylase RimI-like enzyme